MQTPFFSLLVLTLATVQVSPAQQFVSPSERSALEGSSYTHYPLGRASARVQTLHDHIPGGAWIAAHAYRRDAVAIRGNVAGLSCELQVTLSMAPHTAANASPSFAANVGSHAVVVLPRQFISIPATARPSLDPAPIFELIVPYIVPFQVPPHGGTLCVDVEVFGNLTNAGADQNASLYLDAHQQFADGRARQRGFRLMQGCPAPGSAAACHAWMDLWNMPGGRSEIDVSIRNGVPATSASTARGFLLLGNRLSSYVWPLRADCPLHSSGELWFALPGPMSASGSYDGTLDLPPLPPGLRLWCQAGSIALSSVAMSFSDAVTLVSPPLGPVPRPCMRIANGSDVWAPTGAVSASVPVMAFF